jgi:hypothetical protein
MESCGQTDQVCVRSLRAHREKNGYRAENSSGIDERKWNIFQKQSLY